ncbi:hypothetical protein DSO57_1015935 [Entomophthora muscae]|uniref:Uncharacterized protein n=1 Tax=Entomophthora muscae TaxID=34485 RepID=A0ACC2TSL0_9FUNG|nr:hypothetical protein DSO57_1015935 [Entomophthora muscae]
MAVGGEDTLASSSSHLWLCVRIDNLLPLKTWAQGQDLNSEPKFLQAAGPMDQEPTRLRFSGIEPLQADTKNVDPCSETGQTKEINTPNGGLIKVPNGGTKMTTISFMNLKSTLVANQELSPGRDTVLQPDPTTATLKQVNQVAKLRFLTNERTPGPNAILLPLDPSTQSPRACLSQCPDEPPHGKY